MMEYDSFIVQTKAELEQLENLNGDNLEGQGGGEKAGRDGQ